jgi:uncharacterized protein YbjT (DUF2867 family)
MMSTQSKLILVAGATGTQGGAVVRRLLADGWRVRGLTRDLNKPAARTLQGQGVELAAGDLNDRASLDKALDGVYGVFSVQNYREQGVEGELRQGKALAEAVRQTAVQHFIYSSVGGADRNSGVPHFESKWGVEQHVRSLGLPATILRPVAFMDNYNWSRPMILNGVFNGFGLRPEVKLQLIASEDIGGFAALAFANPSEYIGQALEIAGDELTEPEIAGVFSRVIGRPVKYQPLQSASNQDPENVKMNRWFNEAGYRADIPALRAIYPALLTFEAYLRKNGWEGALPMPIPEATQSW